MHSQWKEMTYCWIHTYIRKITYSKAWPHSCAYLRSLSLSFSRRFLFNVEKHAFTIRWKGVQLEGWAKGRWGQICGRASGSDIESNPDCLLQVCSAKWLPCWDSVSSTDNWKWCCMPLSTSLHEDGRSLAHHRHTSKLVPLHLLLKLLQGRVISRNIKGRLLRRTFLSQFHLESGYPSQEWQLCVNSFANSVQWVIIAQSVIPNVPKLF